MGRNRSPAMSTLRIIGGEWRGRKITFSQLPGVRPTGDRVRETLFNWLAPYLTGAKCLDLFAGSGALGLEALSRGAAHCDFVDNQAENIRQISHQLAALDGNQKASVHCGDALTWLAQHPATWDIVFVDPPFDSALGEPSLRQLACNDRLHHNSWVYFESRRSEPEFIHDGSYNIFREKLTGDVCYRLLQPLLS